MRPILSQIFCDNESLLEYERTGSTICFRRIQNRLVATERMMSPQKSDSFYEGLGQLMTETYQSLAELLWLFPYEMSKDYLYQINGFLYVKANRFDGWMNMLCQCPPLFLIAGFFIDKFTLSLLQRPNDLKEFTSRFLRQFENTAQLLPYIKELNYLIDESGGLNDLHIHLNGSTESDIIWSYVLRNPHKTIKDYKEVFNNKNGKVRRLSEQIAPGMCPEVLKERLETAKKLRQELIKWVLINNYGLPEPLDEEGDLDSLWYDFISPKNASPLVDELVFYLLVMNELKKGENEFLARMFHHYMLIRGLIHRFVVMQPSQMGFSQFQMLTDVSFREGVEKYYKQRFMQLGGGTTCYLAHIEGRFSPKGSKIENSQLIAKIKSGFDKACKNNECLKNCRLGLIAHFIKKPDKCRTLPIRHRFLRKDLKKRSLSLVRLLKSNEKCRRLICGVDAAASEFDTGPDVFAPVFRYLRKAGIQNFTYHVGEDFNHLLTGLRVVHEAVDFLELQYGDRLGHCTALGINPRIWIERQGNVCYLSRLEWLDDLVFLWSFIKDTKHPKLQNLKIIIESEIAEFSEIIYGESCTAFALLEAWKLRKCDPFLYLNSESNRVNRRGCWNQLESYEEWEAIQNTLSKENIRKIYERFHAPSADAIEANQIIEIETTRILNVEELEIIQRLTLDKLSQQGIVIEALPTSNLRISFYKELDEYHLIKWLQKETEHCRMPFVVLGTDDPGIFSTNIYNEYARAYMHLQKCGLSSSERLQKISEIHKWSNIYKFIDNDK